MIEAMGLLRSDVYIGNIMNWCLETPIMVVASEATAVHGLLRYDLKAACEIVAGRGLFLPNSFAGYLPFLLFVEQCNDCTEAYFP